MLVGALEELWVVSPSYDTSNGTLLKETIVQGEMFRPAIQVVAFGGITQAQLVVARRTTCILADPEI